jgi:hypothetical protein
MRIDRTIVVHALLAFSMVATAHAKAGKRAHGGEDPCLSDQPCRQHYQKASELLNVQKVRAGLQTSRTAAPAASSGAKP